MKPMLHRRVGLYAAILAGIPVAALAAEAVPPATLIKALDAAVAQWRSGVEFRCRYTFRQGFAPSKAAALEGQFGSRVGKPEDEDRATGVFCKRGQRMRMSADYGRPPDVVEDRYWGSTASNISFDEASTADLFLSYRLPVGNDPGQAAILRRTEADYGLERAGPLSRGILNPFSFGGGEVGSLSRMYAGRPEYGEQVEFLAATAEADHLAITIVRTSPGRHRLVARVTFWRGAAPPVISKIEEEVDATPGGGRRTERVLVASNFVPCGRAMMARVVRSAAGPMAVSGQGQSQWLAKEWVSEDLGNALPSDEDFVITIAKASAIWGLRDPPLPGTVRRLDLSTIPLEEVASPRDAFPDEALAFPGAPSPRRYWWLGLLVVLIVGGLAAALVLRHRRSKPPKDVGHEPKENATRP